jgi:hypothetical protein
VSDTDSGTTTEVERIEATDVGAAIADATKPDEPEIDLPRDGTVHLMYGVEIDGDRYRTATVRELNGGDEEAIARLDQSAWNHFVLQTDLVLRRATESIGPVEVADNPGILQNLIIGDRDILFKEILMATSGPQQEFKNVVCPACQFEHDLEVDFSDLLVTPKLPKGIDPKRVVAKLRDGTEVVFRWPTGADQMAVSQGDEELTMPLANTKMIARCLVTVNGKIEPDPEHWARNLGVKDRQIVLAEMGKMPVVSFKESEVPCEGCGKPLPVTFGWASLL